MPVLERAAAPTEGNAAFLDELLGEVPAHPEEQAAVRAAVLDRSFEYRHALFAETAPAAQVAKWLGISRQAVHNKVGKTLFAASYNGVLRYPLWQFDPEADHGIMPGVPDILNALTGVSDVARLAWMVRPNPYLENRTPSVALRQGEINRVVDAARLIGTQR